MRNEIYALIALVILLSGAMLGMSYVAIQLSKDMRVQTGNLVDFHGKTLESRPAKDSMAGPRNSDVLDDMNSTDAGRRLKINMWDAGYTRHPDWLIAKKEAIKHC